MKLIGKYFLKNLVIKVSHCWLTILFVYVQFHIQYNYIESHLIIIPNETIRISITLAQQIYGAQRLVQWNYLSILLRRYKTLRLPRGFYTNQLKLINCRIFNSITRIYSKLCPNLTRIDLSSVDRPTLDSITKTIAKT